MMENTMSPRKPSECEQELELLLEKYGRSELFRSVTRLLRRRVNRNRDPRKAVPWSQLREIARRQHFICAICRDPEKPMRDKPGYTVVDHIDPNRKDFNHPDNLQAAHKSCNATKGAKSIYEQAIERGMTIHEFIRSQGG